MWSPADSAWITAADAADPEEKLDIAALEPERLRTLREILERWQRTNRPGQRTEKLLELDAREREQLRALGYLDADD